MAAIVVRMDDVVDDQQHREPDVTRSTIYFPLRSNASALFAGPGVAGVRRRILAAALLYDEVLLEDGLHVAWAGETGGSSMTAHGGPAARWQTTRQRGRAAGQRHYVALRPTGAPETAPSHAMVSSEAVFSWRATFEPYRRELPASAATWLHFGHARDEYPANEIVRAWESADRVMAWRNRQARSHAVPAGGPFVRDAILKSGYLDLAIAATMGAAVSLDRRHRLAVETRVRAGDAQPLGGHYALELLLPTDFSWDDVSALRRHRALRDYRSIMREIESEALMTSRSGAEIDDRIRREYERQIARAAGKGVPLTGRVALQAVGFILGAIADAGAPLVGGAAVTAGTLVAGEVLDRARRPRWLAVDRRIRGRRNGL